MREQFYLDRPFLKQFTNFVEQHHAYCFWQFVNGDRPDGGNRHQKILIKHLPSDDVASGRLQHSPTTN